MPKIESILAFISTDADATDEGIVAHNFYDVFKGDNWMPLIGADEARIRSLRPIAEEIARKTGKKIILVKFSQREVLEEL